jgi:transposase-like protein
MERESREVWAKRVERLADSGLTLKEFAAEIGVNANTLAGWRWRIQRAKGTGTDVAAPASPPPPFLEFVAPPADEIRSECKPEPECTAEPFELVLEDGHRIRVPVRFDPTALRRLVDVLEAR